MLFNSWVYLIFLPTVLVAFWALPHRFRGWLLLVASAVFYGWWDYRFLGLMAISILIDYVCALRIDSGGARRRWLALSMVANLGLLGVFKYFDFFSRSAAALLESLGFSVDPILLQVTLPVGISFYTFQSMSYTIDVYRREIPSTRNLLDFAVYVSFFPQLVAGPIERATALLPQVQTPRQARDIQWKLSLYWIVWGLYKKVVVADNLARVVATCLDDPTPTAGGVAIGVLAFAFQIYCDFSGYTDIARGSAGLLGFNLRENFHCPYFARSPSEFWTRWHISLSTWLRDYLYIPLGGNRGGRARTIRNLAIVMLLGGLWHGAAWTFVIWGAYHALLLIIYRIAFGQAGRPTTERVWQHLFWGAVMFILTLVGWAIFRAQDLPQLTALGAGIAGGNWSAPDGALRDTVFLISGVLLVMIVKESRDDMTAPGRMPCVPWLAFIVFLLGAIALFGSNGGVEFIYFQF